jgi:PKD repeat protein
MGFPAALFLVLALLFGACSGPGGNHPPQIAAFQASPTEGEAPLTVRFTWTVQDTDGDALRCVLKPGDGVTLVLDPCGTSYTYTYTNPNDYTALLQVSDRKGATAQKSALVRVRAKKDFTLSLNPTSLTVQQGGSNSTQLTITPQNGFTGTVALSLVDGSGNPVPGITLSPTSVNVTGSSPVSQNLTVNVAASVAPGTYILQLRATSGSLTKAANLSLTVTAPATDFSMVLESNTLTLAPGGIAYVRLSVTGSGGTLSLSLVDSNNNPFPYVSLSPTTTPIPSAPMLELSASPSLAPGTYPLKVQGTSNGVTKEAPLTLEVRTASTANLRILKAEWGQTVLKENLRLVAGKEALLRVHLVAAPSALSLSQPLAGAVYQGSAFVGNLSFTCPNPIPTTTAQGNLSTTCNATLPGNWVAPGLRVELQADPNDQVAETNESDNALTLNPSVGPGTALFLTVVPVVHQGQTASVPSFSQTLWRVWPLKETPYTTRAPYTFSGTLSGQDANAWSQLLDELRALRQADGSGRYYYGFVKVGYTSGIAGIGYIGYPVAVGWDYSQSAPAVMAHELGHNFGRNHAPCGTGGDPYYPYPDGKIGAWGYDLASGALKDPNQYYDLMSYCGPQWVSDYSYQGAQSFLENNLPRPQSLPEEGLLFSGRIRGDEVVFNPPLRLAVAPEGKPSPYRLRADGVEAEVYVLEDSEGTLHFQARLPLRDWSRLALYREGILLKEVARGLGPQAEPTAELREEGGFVRVRWTGYPYLSLIHVAPEGNRTTLGLWHRGGEARFPTEGLPPGGWFEVQLSQGLGVLTFLFPR